MLVKNKVQTTKMGNVLTGTLEKLTRSLKDDVNINKYSAQVFISDSYNPQVLEICRCASRCCKVRARIWGTSVVCLLTEMALLVVPKSIFFSFPSLNREFIN